MPDLESGNSFVLAGPWASKLATVSASEVPDLESGNSFVVAGPWASKLATVSGSEMPVAAVAGEAGPRKSVERPSGPRIA